MLSCISYFLYFFSFTDPAPTEIYTLSLHDALPILIPVATQADVRRLALSLPDTEEAPNHFAFSVRNRGKLKGFVAVRVANLSDKDVLLALDPEKFFTEPHYTGFPPSWCVYPP